MKYRFLDEYTNYVRKRFQAADLPKDIKVKHISDINRIPNDTHNGFITVPDAMKQLVSAEEWLNDYNYYGEIM